MSHVLIRRLAGVKRELEVARICAEYLQSGWSRLHSSPPFENLALKEVRRTVSNLEATYIVRLFTTFESMLRDFLPLRHPGQPDRRSAFNLINLAASRQHIPAPLRDQAQQVREYRNQAVHEGSTTSTPLLFGDALASLNQFLSWLPNPP